ncbi:MAG: hypothetical protein QOF62_3324 [Pyrinomonadaceae bacterium]|jgi:hypothetical protein|nr:hypothetical protein [Pyrinomonadaceae bacterium]
MWNSFFRAFFVVGMVMGGEEIVYSVYWAIKKNRLLTLRWLLRGTSFLLVYAVSYWWLSSRSGVLWDEPLFYILAFCPTVLTMASEVYLRVYVEKKPVASMFERPSGNNNDPESMKRLGKKRFVAGFALVFGLIMVCPAIVFSIVSPELLAFYWWPLIILILAFVGLLVGIKQWNSREKLFHSMENQP